MQPDHLGDEEVHRFGHRREFGEGNEVDHLREPVNHGQDGIVVLRVGETGYKVQGDV